MVSTPSTEKVGLPNVAPDYTNKDWVILVALSSVSFSSGICVSIQGPIYPQKAEEKGANATEYGMVFGIYSLVGLIVCPIYGKYMDKIGANVLVICGMALAGLCSIGFGMLDFFDSHLVFIGSSFVLRILESIGTSACFMASFSIAAVLFTKNTATIYALLECCFGIGFAIGPTVGEYFFEVGGFVLPFFLVGGVLLIDAIFLVFTLPDISDEHNEDRPPVKISTVLKLVPVLLDLLSVLVANLSVGFNMATLEPHLRQFGITNTSVGAIFAISAATYLLSTPLVGRLCDTHIYSKKLLIVGASLVIISFSLIGPLPFLPIRTSLWMIYLGLTLHGLGLSCLMVPGFIGAIKSAVRCGLPDDITTYSVVTGLSTSSLNIGTFLGPSIAGLLFDLGGYRYATLFVIVVHAMLLVALLWFVLTEKKEDDSTETTEAKKAPQSNPPPYSQDPSIP